jgi:biopolymer transport protein ExbD
VKSDQRARFERVVEVVENLRAAGVDQLGLLTESYDNKMPTGEGASAAMP